MKIALVSKPWVAQIHSTGPDGTTNILPSFKIFHTIFDAYKWIRNEPKMVGDMMVLIHKHEDGTILRLNKAAQESYTWTPVDF